MLFICCVVIVLSSKSIKNYEKKLDLCNCDVLLCISGLLIFSCSKENDSWSNWNKTSSRSLETKYLYIEEPENGEFSMEQLEILGVAFDRISKYLVMTNDSCFLTVDYAAEVYMSDELFSLMQQSVDNKNAQYRAYLYFREHRDLGITIENPFDIQVFIPRTKAETEGYYDGFTSTTVTKLSHAETMALFEDLKKTGGAVEKLAEAIALRYTGAVGLSLVKACSYFVSAPFAKAQNEYLELGSSSGITIRESTAYSSTTGTSSTVYSISVNQ